MLKTIQINRTPGMFIKPSELIDVHEISPLTLTDRRVFNQLIANAWDNIIEDKEHIISKVALKGHHKGNERLENSILKLMGTIVQVKVKKDGKDAIQRVQLLSDNVEQVDKNGLVYYRFSSGLIKLMANSNVWARISQEVMFAFTSKYSLALYEMVQKRKNMRINREKFSITEFRALLGVPKGKLKLFGDFNRYALSKAVKEVNALSDIEVRLVPLKRSRQVTDIEMWWFEKDLPKAKEAYAELQRSKVGRKARIDGTVEIPVLDRIIGNKKK